MIASIEIPDHVAMELERVTHRSPIVKSPHLSLPQQIAALALQNAKTIYSILFRAMAETMLTIAADPSIRRSVIRIIPPKTAMQERCVVSMIGKTSADSRRSVINPILWIVSEMGTNPSKFSKTR